MTKKERLEEIIRYYSDGKPSVFAKYIGVAPSTISTWLARNTLDYDLIFAKCENINAEWLMTGKGEMLNSDLYAPPMVKANHNVSYIPPTAPTGETSIATPTNNPKEGIPLIPVEAMAGALTCEQMVLEYECERYVVPVFKGADFLIPVKGSSMYPKYSSGDIVACQRVAMSDLFFQWNKVYVIDTNQGALIKRIKPGSDKNHVLIVSDNEKYDPFELPVSAIHAVALVIGVIRLE